MDWIEENGEKRQKQFYVKCNFFSRHFSFELFSFLVHFLAAYNEFYFLFSFLKLGSRSDFLYMAMHRCSMNELEN